MLVAFNMQQNWAAKILRKNYLLIGVDGGGGLSGQSMSGVSCHAANKNYKIEYNKL